MLGHSVDDPAGAEVENEDIGYEKILAMEEREPVHLCT